jgi:ATP-binding cassette subfamily C protein/ATP-binding cassette subfamily C protein LapB
VIEKACAEAGILAEIRGLADGFDTRIGDQRLQQLSAGFLQRLSLARAYLKDVRIMLFDEPVQGLDEAGDAAFMELLGAVKGRRTMLLVTHRPSHVRLADRVLLLDGGQLAAVGRPEEVLAKMAAIEQ